MEAKVKFRKLSEREVAFLRIALGMSGSVMINDATAALILLTQDEMKRLGGEFSLRDAARVADHVDKKYVKSVK